MSATPDLPDLERRLAEAERPLAPRRLPPAPLPVRLQTSPALRRLVPMRAAVAWAEAAARREWERDAEMRDHLRATMEAIVAGTPRAGEVEELARAHLIEWRVRDALFWRPWPPSAVDARSEAHVRAALATGRPVLVTTNHLAPVFTGMRALRHIHSPGYVVAAPWLLERHEGKWGRWIAQWHEGARLGDMRLLEVGRGSFGLILEVLRRRGLVYLAFDMPGSVETQFLGKPVMLASGSAKLAHAAQALVLPMRQRRDGHRIRSELLPAVDAAEHDRWEDLHVALARIHERWILETPHALENPRRAGAWEDGATAQGWRLPDRR